MIIKNGYIKLLTQAAGKLDSNGFPTVPTPEYSDFVPCQINLKTLDRTALTTGEHYTIQQYIVYIEGDRTGTTVQLYNSQQELIGDFQIQSSEYLQAVSQTKIILL